MSICKFSYFHFGSEGGTFVLITSVPGHACLFMFILSVIWLMFGIKGFQQKKKKDTFFMFINIFQYQIIQINCVKVKITAET